MRFLVGAFSFLSMASVVCLGSSYDKVMANFKQELYQRQQLMEYKEYNKFIEPYIQEAEKSLMTTRYIMKNPDSQLSSDFLNCLLSYNVECFYACAVTQTSFFRTSGSKKKIERQLEDSSKHLFNVIAEIARIENFDSQEEMNKVAKLIKKVNVAFYKKLKLGTRFQCYLFL